MTPRCYLFVPGDNDRMLAKATERGADAVIVDLEDAVAPSARAAALEGVRDWTRKHRAAAPEIWVRIPGAAPIDEISRLVGPGLSGVVFPKANTASEVSMIAQVLSSTTDRPGLIVIIETAQALQNVDEVAGVPGVSRLMSGEADMAAQLGLAPDDENAWAPIRSRIVVASAAAHLPGPIGPVNPDFSDPDALRYESQVLRRQGFRSRAAIHPAQVAPYTDAFTPSEEELLAATEIIALYEAALADGRGAIVDDAGNMVDEAVVKIAQRRLADS